MYSSAGELRGLTKSALRDAPERILSPVKVVSQSQETLEDSDRIVTLYVPDHEDDVKLPATCHAIVIFVFEADLCTSAFFVAIKLPPFSTFPFIGVSETMVMVDGKKTGSVETWVISFMD